MYKISDADDLVIVAARADTQKVHLAHVINSHVSLCGLSMLHMPSGKDVLSGAHDRQCEQCRLLAAQAGIHPAWDMVLGRIREIDDRAQRAAEELSAGTRPFDKLMDKLESGNRRQRAAHFILEWGQVKGDHHRAWTLDQTLRILLGEEYDEAVRLFCEEATPGDGGFEWDAGIAP